MKRRRHLENIKVMESACWRKLQDIQLENSLKSLSSYSWILKIQDQVSMILISPWLNKDQSVSTSQRESGQTYKKTRSTLAQDTTIFEEKKKDLNGSNLCLILDLSSRKESLLRIQTPKPKADGITKSPTK